MVKEYKSLGVSPSTYNRIQRVRKEIIAQRIREPGDGAVVIPNMDDVINLALDALEEQLEMVKLG